MRRYVVRFSVAVLTFGLGVALSLAFGLFRFSETKSKFVERNWGRRDCPKKGFRVARPAFLTVDSQVDDPVRLVYLGTMNDASRGDELRMRFSIGNNSDKTITGYWIAGNEIWDTSAKTGPYGLYWTAFQVLEPGETSTITLPQKAEGSSLRVTKVNFQDGSIWTNPRATQ